MTEKNGNATPQDFPGAAAMKHLAELGVKASDMAVVPIATTGLSVSDGLPPAVPVGWDRNGQKPISLKSLIEEFRDKPERRKGTAKAQTLASFITLTKRHQDPDSAVFADMAWTAPKFTAVIDYHHQSSGEDHADHTPRWLGHRIEYTFPLGEDWKLWVEQNGKPMKQGDFAVFIEDRIADLSAATDTEKDELEFLFKCKIADPFEILQLSRGLSISVDAKVTRAQNLTTGEAEIQFSEVHNDSGGQKLTVPGLFMVSVPVFYGGAPVRLPARLRYRVSGSNIVWFYQLWRPDVYVTTQIKRDRDAVAVETGLPVYEGAPEAAAQ